MGKTRKNAKPRKDKKDLEDLIKEDLDLSDTDSVSSESDSDSVSDVESETSVSKELNKMINETMGNVKDSDMTMPAIGIGLLAIIGFALYKGVNIKV